MSFEPSCFGFVWHVFPVWPPEAVEVAEEGAEEGAEAVVILVPVKPEVQECFGRWLLMLKDVALEFVDKKQGEEGEEEALLDDWKETDDKLPYILFEEMCGGLQSPS
jgi:hypothetical protein